MQIVINVADDGQITVEADGQEPYMCETTEECLEYVEGLMPGGEEPEPEEEAEEAEPDVAAMWNEEAAMRPKNPNLMR